MAETTTYDLAPDIVVWAALGFPDPVKMPDRGGDGLRTMCLWKAFDDLVGVAKPYFGGETIDPGFAPGSPRYDPCLGLRVAEYWRYFWEMGTQAPFYLQKVYEGE